ncbi:MAG: serine/threonine-protein kinase, partial [Acidobacteria bacterium]|nr:serine/threonine-protein kinase [Acidobacteriota bacterium]
MVFLARHSILGRLSALKVIIPDLVSDADTFLERFLREAQLLAGLKHPNIVDIYDFDISDYGLPYYAMEYVEGISLRNLLACEGRNLSIEDLGSVLNMCASALDYSHKKGIVHRDLKPENILISLSENKVVPKILDFGIAKMLTQESSKTLTGEGNIIGTLHYIAPEQILGGKISPKTDQYSFALIVAEIVSGKILREGKTLGEICASDIQKPLDKNRLPENVSENIATAIQKATSKEPDLRYATVSDFVSALEIKEPEKPDKLTLIVQRTTIGVSPTITPQFSKDILSQLSSKKSKTVSSSPSTPIPPLSANKPKPIFLYGAIVFAVFLAVLATILFVFKKSNKKEYDKKEYLICQKTGEWQVPPDTSAVLSSFEGTSAILKGAKSLYMVKFLTNQVPSSFPIEQSEIFIGITPTGDPFFLNNGKIVRKNLEESSEKIIMDFSKEKYDFATVSNSARTLAVGGNKTIYFYSLLFENNAPISKISLEFPISEFKAKKLSDKFFAFIANGIFTVYDISNGNKILSVPFSENVFSVFIDDVSEYAAVWGWFDKISVFSLNGGENKDIRITGEPRDLIIIPDRPTIVVSGTFGIRFIDLKSSEVFYEDSAEGKALSSLLYSPKGILALNKEKSALMQYSLRTSEPDKIVKVCDNEIWAITKDIKNETLYLGGVDGKIYCVDKNDLIKTKELHTLGVTALATCEDHLISSSDDKSIAVLKLPSLDVEYRSTAHTYLINYLLVKGTPKKLWSSSSDGSLKSWSIPNLQEIFSFSVEAELKKKSSLHAFWVSQDEKKMVIGTWNHKVVYINKENSP